MSRTPLNLVSALGMALLVLSSCDPGAEDASTDNGTSNPANWGGAGGNGSGGNGSGEEGAAMPDGMHFGAETGSGGDTGGDNGGPVTNEGPGPCSVDANCPAEAPFCSISGYCLACLEDSHCTTGLGCFGGECLPLTCTPGDANCSTGTTLHTCETDGTWATTECPGQQGQCVNGACTGCDPGFAQCVGKSERWVCLPDGSALVTEQCPGDSNCVEGKCLECYPGTSQCNGDWVQTCTIDGQWENSENCGASMGQCSSGMCQSPCGQVGKLSNEGCDYWAIDMDNAGPAANSPYAVIVSNLNTYEVFITITAQSNASGTPTVVAEGPIAPQTLEAFQLPQQNLGSSGIYWKALRIQTTGPIVAYQFNPLENVNVFSNDASLLLPTNTYGNEYVVVSREEIPGSGTATYRGSIAIVAASENTEVSITASTRTMGGSGIPALNPGDTATVTLQPYQVLNIQSDQLGGDLTGTLVLSDKPIGVFGGHEAAVGEEQCCADHLEQQLFPVDTWGQTYVGSKSKARGVERDYWRVVAATDGTTVSVSPALPGVPATIQLNRGDHYEFKTEKDFVLNSSVPVMVAQTLASSKEIVGPLACSSNAQCADGYSCSWVNPECMADSPYCSTNNDCPGAHTCSCGDLGFCTCEPMGDPALILAVPVEQYRSQYLFLTPTNFLNDYINVVAPIGATVMLDGKELPASSFETLAGGTWRVGRFIVVDGVHQLEASAPVGVVVYGYDDDVSYGYPAGLDLTVQN